jgi:hypothetical protein
MTSDETEEGSPAAGRDWTKSGLRPMPDTPGEIIKARIGLDTYLKAEMARLDTYYKPMREWLQAADNKLLELLNEQGCDSFKTEHGTAYRSVITSVKVEDREKFLDFVLDETNWDKYGNEMLMASPQKDAVKRFAEEHNGVLPPGLSTSAFTRVNIRRS